MAISRRELIIGATGAGVGFGLGAFSHSFPLPPPEFGPDWQPGEWTTLPSTCTLCPAHCGIAARSVDGALTQIGGNPLHPISRGGLCPKGAAGVQLYYHPDRIRGPLRRMGPRGSTEFAPITWEQGLDELTRALASARESGAQREVEWIVGDAGRLTGDLIAGFCGAFGADRIFVDDYRDGSSEILRLCQGIDAPPAFDLGDSDFVLSFGAALSEAWWALPEAAGVRRGEAGDVPRWVQVDARLSRTAVCADDWVPIAPGTYGTLALGIAYVLLKEGLYDAETVTRYVDGWEDWTDDEGGAHLGFRRLVLRHGRPDFVSSRTGIPLARLIGLAKRFGQARRPLAVWDQVVAWRRGGMADALAIHALNVLAGRLNRPGGLLVQQPLPLTDLSPVGASGDGAPSLSRAPLACTSWPLDDATPPVVFLYKANPLASGGMEEPVRQALARAGMVVSFSPFLDETTRHADLVLPESIYLERWEDAPAPAAVAFPVWGVVRPVTEPRHDTRTTGDVILEVASRLGGDAGSWARWSSTEEIVRQRGIELAGADRGSAFVQEFRRDELRELEGRGWWLPHGRTPEEYWQEILDSGGWFDPFYDYHDRSAASQLPGGRIWLFPPEARARLRAQPSDLAEGFLPRTAPDSADASGGEEYPLRLIPYRVLTLSSGGTALMPWLLENLGFHSGEAWKIWAEIHPRTARDLGLHSGQRVRVEAAGGGAFEATLQVFAGAQPGVLSVPYGLHTAIDGWGRLDGGNPLAAVGDRVDSTTGLPDWYSTDVRVVPS